MIFESFYYKRLMGKITQLGWNVYVCQNITVNVSKRLKPLFLDLYFQFCKYSHTLKLFVYLYLIIRYGPVIVSVFSYNFVRINEP